MYTKELPSLYNFVRCDHPHPPRSKSLNKMIGLFKNAFLYIIEKTCNKVMCNKLAVIFFIPDRFNTQAMCIKAAEVGPSNLRYIPDHFYL